MTSSSSPSDASQPYKPAANGDARTAASLEGKRIIVALSGGIACYKVASLVSRLVQAGAQVRVLMTPGATRFITPLTFESLSGSPVVTSIWPHAASEQRSDEEAGMSVVRTASPHIALARWCDAMVIAPASADMIAKLAHGLTDDIVSLVACALPRAKTEHASACVSEECESGGTPLLLAPAMNADMWANPIVQRNVAALRDMLGATFIGPDEGWQACRTMGLGRMSEPDTILAAVQAALSHV